jgi:amino acid adenylation domain-containing protein
MVPAFSMSNLIQAAISRQADARPDACAVHMGAAQLTYGALEQQSNQLAHALRDAGAVRGDRVYLMLPKSPQAIVGMLGVLKADCAYVPMDLASPVERLRRIMTSVEGRWVLAATSSANRLSEMLRDDDARDQPSIVWMDENEPPAGLRVDRRWADLRTMPSSPVEWRNTPHDLAHILFTSGSTGEPKGVMITHDNVGQFLRWAAAQFRPRPDDRISGHPPLHFDLSTFDVFGTLSAGATLYPVAPEVSLFPQKLAAFIRDNELTQWFSVPSLLSYMAKFDVVRDGDFPAMSRLLWCGERMPTPTLIYWMRKLPHVTFTNLYGPTEATIASSFYQIPACPADDTEEIPIGVACDGEELMVLNERLDALPRGEVGELYIRGAGLSPGYWRDPARTASAFRLNPFSSDRADRLYRTGDLAHVGHDGLFYLHGRLDSQIKSRGYRIELGEIETALHRIDDLQESAVVAVEMDGFEGSAICCAYVLKSGQSLSPRELRSRLATMVPSYMIPSHWRVEDTLPLNANGKIDRPALRERFKAINTAASTVSARGDTRI